MMTGKQKKGVIELFNQGFNYSQIQKKVGINKNCIRDFLIKIGKARPAYKNILSLEDSILALKLHRSGNNLKTLAKKFGVSDKSISNSFIHHRLVNPSEKMRLSHDEVDTARIIELFESGKSLTKIGEFLKISKHRVSDILENSGKRAKGNNYIGLTYVDAKNMNDMIKSGKNYKEVAATFGCGSGAVKKCLIRNGFDTIKTRLDPIKENQKSQIIKRYEETGSYQKVAKELKLKHNEVKNFLISENIQIRTRKYGEETGDKLEEMFKYSGLSIQEISDTIGVETKVLQRFKKDRGFKRIVPLKNKPRSNKGVSLYDSMVKKWGKKDADVRYAKCIEKHSKNAAGENNHMYGKPSPMGSGYGIKGWHKGRFFRSLRELSFMLNYIDRFNLKEESLEKRKYRIPYIDPMGADRTYAGDFLINDQFFVEIKPKRLWESPSVKAKAEAGRKFCKERGWKYKLIDPIVNNDQVIKEYLAGNIKFNEKSLGKFLEFNNLESSQE